jgi:uncharacterized membrane protein YphA (DoxX/SURF4 family)
MSTLSEQIRQTDKSKVVATLRIVAGLPLLLFGAMHLIDPAPFRAILEASGIPFVELNLIAAPVTELVAGLFLVTGYFARLGGLGGAVTMLAAAWSTAILAGLNAAPEVPPMPLPLVVLAISTFVLWRGAGAWSLDGRTEQQSTRLEPATQQAE